MLQGGGLRVVSWLSLCSRVPREADDEGWLIVDDEAPVELAATQPEPEESDEKQGSAARTGSGCSSEASDGQSTDAGSASQTNSFDDSTPAADSAHPSASAAEPTDLSQSPVPLQLEKVAASRTPSRASSRGPSPSTPEVQQPTGRPLSSGLSRRTGHRLASVAAAAKRTVLPHALSDPWPLFTQHLPDVTLGAIHAAFLDGGEDTCPLRRFLREVLECYDVSATDWAESDDASGALERRINYKTPLPDDVPDGVSRLCRLPGTILGTTLVSLHGVTDDELIVTQNSYTSNVLYSDRFWLHNTMSFKMDGAGGVTLRQWTEVIWSQPLPWTHGIVKFFIERKAKSGARDTASDFARIVGEIP
mmetsp:Transcript_50552/g.141560  ORF Transcript_50552/g.141560 Transcript_50552/m.141560 type:complete len:362 (-) Transcript_50552:135-1220(-)|eukprot:CAMPEP_0117533646 /NCGR_PEP_ID=MMETSP0784-20121206/40000_1 /TAXON_ID=39447 /ORGANISM="" /LENGTH=361 /DNA_ID=CAMNT_0005330095 /DNA_START=37 /DNA_END=1122 /DNA_ORIENTATION=-